MCRCELFVNFSSRVATITGCKLCAIDEQRTFIGGSLARNCDNK